MEYLDKLEYVFTASQQATLLIITIGIMMALQVIKMWYFAYYPKHSKAKKKATLWMTAFLLGVVSGYLGYKYAIPSQPMWFWLFISFSTGGGAICVFKVFVEIVWTKAKDKYLAKP